MGRPLTYVPVPVQLRLKLAQLRRTGMSFERAWFAAVRLECEPLITMETPVHERKSGICWPVDTDERASWVAVTVATKDVWRRAYEGMEQTTSEHGAALLWTEVDGSQPHERLEALAMVKVA